MILDISEIALPGIFLLGLLVGSFLNVVILRLPIMMDRDWRSQCTDLLGIQSSRGDSDPAISLTFPASHCPSCKAPIRPWENIPVISYLFLRGKCHNCGAPISIRYPLIEFTTALLSLLAVWHFGLTAQAIAAILISWSLVALTFIDFDHQLLPDQITLPLIWLGLLFNLEGTFTDLASAVIGAVSAYLFLWGIFQLFKLLTGKEGMGFGDFKLYAVFGAWLGWQMLPQILLISALVGSVIGVSLILIRGQDRNIPIPFGPYLALGGWIALYWGQDINHAYLTYAGLA